MGSNRLEGRAALVTGAGSGIGRASALRFAAEGAAVMCADIDQQAAEGTVALITEQQGRADSIGVDVSDSQQVSDAIARCTADLGGMHVLFNNAGVGGGFDWDQTIAVNLTGVFNGLKHGADHMARNGGGAIINTASIAGLVGLTGPHLANLEEMEEGPGAYIAAKHGVSGLTKQYAINYGRFGVRVNAIAPGFVQTRFASAIVDSEELSKTILDRTPLQRFGVPEDVAGLVVYLASEASAFVTGSTFVADGGLTLG